MSFFRVVAGVDNTDEARNVLTTPGGILITKINNPEDFSGDPLSGSIASNTSYIVSDNQEVDKTDFYVFDITIPDDSSNLYYADIFIGTQAEIVADLVEDVTTVANTSTLTAYNRNRNSSSVTTATFAQVVQGSDPVTGGNTIISDYIPRDESLKPNLGRLILKNDTKYALRIKDSRWNNNNVMVRIDLGVISA